MVRRLRALVVNDDGIAAPGLAALAGGAFAAGMEVLVAAPSVDASGSSASMKAVESDGRVRVHHHTLPGLPEVPAYGVEGHPAYITFMAVHGAFGPPPDLVLSGINLGPNLGHLILHSGTVGAALTAAEYGLHGMALSLAVHWRGEDVTHWPTAVEVLHTALPLLLGAPPASVLNINVPNLPADQLRGLRRAELAHEGAVEVSVDEVSDGHIRRRLHEVDRHLAEDGDEGLLRAGFATMTAIRPVTVDPNVRLPEHVPVGAEPVGAQPRTDG